METLQGLSDAEAKYFKSLRNAVRFGINLDNTLANNQLYYEKLFELYKLTKDLDERMELTLELDYLIDQGLKLKNIQLNLDGGSA